VAFFMNGDILIGNGGTSSVKWFDSSGNYIQDLISSGAGNLLTPNAVVLRTVTPTGTGEPPDRKKIIFIPSYGSIFRLSPDAAGLITNLDVFDALGNKVAAPDPGTDAWVPSDLPDGIYFVQATFTDDESFVQKLIIKK